MCIATFLTPLLASFEFVREATFVDWLRGGLELTFTVAIDFTGSNGTHMSSNAMSKLIASMTQFRRAAPAHVAALHQPRAAHTVLHCRIGRGRRHPGLQQVSA